MTELAILIVSGLVSLSRKYRRRDLRDRETRNVSNMLDEEMKANVSYITTLHDNIPTKNNVVYGEVSAYQESNNLYETIDPLIKDS